MISDFRPLLNLNQKLTPGSTILTTGVCCCYVLAIEEASIYNKADVCGTINRRLFYPFNLWVFSILPREILLEPADH